MFESFIVEGRYTYSFSELIEDVDGHTYVLSMKVGYIF